MFDIPILLVVFNRPDTTRRVFDVIRDISPREIFIAADGPRPDKLSDRSLVREVREIVRTGPAQCKIHYLFRQRNIGCGRNMAQAITWFFKHVSEGIILEDDCLPDPTFFPYCREMLQRYRNNRSIMNISGDNFQRNRRRGNASYYFSIFPNTWGWATWRRAWKFYKFSLGNWNKSVLLKNFSRTRDIVYWQQTFDRVRGNAADIWDYQWIYACWSRSGLSISPQVNLIKNIGLRPDATHTKNVRFLSRNQMPMKFPLKHPRIVISDRRADELIQYKIFMHANRFNSLGIMKFPNIAYELLRYF